MRVIAATNRDLKAEVAAGRFRADLYHRLSVYPLLVPPLRERGDDVLLLAGYFIERNQRRLGLNGVRLSRRARQWLTHYDWPGNVRELEHTLSRAMIRALSATPSRERVIELGIQHLGTEVLPMPDEVAAATEPTDQAPRPLDEIIDHCRRKIILTRLKQHDGNKAAAARSLGIDRGNFHRLLRKLKLG